MPQSYTSYEESISEDKMYACRGHRKSLGLPIDIDLDDIECATVECCEGCPL